MSSDELAEYEVNARPMPESPTLDISVVIPCYNAEAWVGRAIDSVLAQEGVSVEVIVIDDGSTDGSVEVLRRYSERIHWETGPNRGACAARNRGLAQARADYVMFLDADDYLEGYFLSGAVEALNSGTDLVFGRVLFEEGRARHELKLPLTEDTAAVILSLITRAFIPPCGIVWRAEFVRQAGGWMDELRRSQDYEMLFRALSFHPRVTTFGTGAGIYFQHPGFHRISHKTDRATVLDQIRAMTLVREYVATSGATSSDIMAALSRQAYRLWRKTCRNDDPALARLTQQLYEDFGGRGHVGSHLHKASASLLGLRAKERLILRLQKYLVPYVKARLLLRR